MIPERGVAKGGHEEDGNAEAQGMKGDDCTRGVAIAPAFRVAAFT
jgi:hypothetical protein